MSYIEEIVINSLREKWETEGVFEPEEKDRQQLTEASLGLIRSLLQDLVKPGSQRPDTDNVTEWMSKVERGMEDPLLIILLFLAPNVRTLHFNRYYGRLPARTLCEIANRTLDSTLPEMKCLSKAVFDLDYEDDSFWPIGTFANLPSMRTIHADRVYGEYSEDIADDDPRQSKTNVTDIVFTNANVNRHALQHFLSASPKLEKFTYEPCNPSMSEQECFPFDPGYICSELFTWAEHTLKFLKLHARCWKPSYMGTLENFTALAIVETDWGLLRNDAIPREYQLTDALPASIEQVLLQSGSGPNIDVSVDALRYLVQAKSSTFPTLREIVLAHTRLPRHVEKLLEVQAEQQHITIEFDRTINSDLENDSDGDPMAIVAD